MEPMNKTSNVTRLPGTEDIRLREPPEDRLDFADEMDGLVVAKGPQIVS